MQIKKEILLFLGLVLVSISLIMAADSSDKIPVNCNIPGTTPNNCCKNYSKPTNYTLPWNFITQGILHINA